MKKNAIRFAFFILHFALLFSCGGTDTGNPAVQNYEPNACSSYSPATFTCSDLSVVGRDPTNNCEFYPCP